MFERRWVWRSGRAGDRASIGPFGGMAVGAGLMYLLDPRRGASRRAVLLQQAFHGLRATERLVASGTRDLEHRARGLVAEAGARLRPDRPGDDQLAARVRARLGRLTAHPHAIRVAAHGGEVELSGPILARERRGVVAGVASVRGVRAVTDRLEPHEDAAHVPALQGGRAGGGASPWPPGTRLLAGAAGAWLLARGVLGDSLLKLPMALSGLAVLVRVASNAPIGRTAGAPPILLRKSIHIGRPVDEVYAFFTDFQNIPRFMTHVRDVRATGEGRSRWVVDGPGGTAVEWEAITTALEPNHRVAWESTGDSAVRTAGEVRFEEARGGTRMDVALRYAPPAGSLGHAVARLLGADPRRRMDDDLVRLKSLLERGKATGRGGTVTLDELKSVDSMQRWSGVEEIVGDPGGGLHATATERRIQEQARATKGARAQARGEGAPPPAAGAAAPPPAALRAAAEDERKDAERREPTVDGG